MTEDEARDWIDQRFGTHAVDRLERFIALVIDENGRQNLIASSNVPFIWLRHAMDSAQLLLFDKGGLWLDIGTGGGFPGMVVALLRHEPVLLVEPRRRRAAFLQQCIQTFHLTHVNVSAVSVEALNVQADIISARAVAAVEKLLHIAKQCAKKDARWLLPRGRFSEQDVVDLQHDWRGTFHVEHSLTDIMSAILVIDGIAPR